MSAATRAHPLTDAARERLLDALRVYHARDFRGGLEGRIRAVAERIDDYECLRDQGVEEPLGLAHPRLNPWPLAPLAGDELARRLGRWVEAVSEYDLKIERLRREVSELEEGLEQARDELEDTEAAAERHRKGCWL